MFLWILQELQVVMATLLIKVSSAGANIELLNIGQYLLRLSVVATTGRFQSRDYLVALVHVNLLLQVQVLEALGLVLHLA
mmetsp:Transcript_31731/g.42030  ORF Transcript_31731/g.42030 Transcript_31731/m.42030 type:complete len:80 (+) Transcript_31731:540-779(+)